MIIETKRLILRTFLESDYKDVFDYLKSPTVNCFQDMKTSSIEEAKRELIKRVKEKNECYFAICIKDSGKVIGEVFSEPEQYNEDTYSPCWMINSEYQRQGFAYEAISAYLEYLFTSKNARRIYIYTEDYNIACQKLCEKLGMRKEGLFLEFISFVNNAYGTPKYENTIQYEILKKEWIELHS